MGYRRIANATSYGPQIHLSPRPPFVGLAPRKFLAVTPAPSNRNSHRFADCSRARTARTARLAIGDDGLTYGLWLHELRVLRLGLLQDECRDRCLCAR